MQSRINVSTYAICYYKIALQNSLMIRQLSNATALRMLVKRRLIFNFKTCFVEVSVVMNVYIREEYVIRMIRRNFEQEDSNYNDIVVILLEQPKL